ncbi:MAG: hypothetical protein Q7N50_07855, partial [Armatimonadota bacterium]|nr:hypothetical protein [Armatimonadota bacterium]
VISSETDDFSASNAFGSISWDKSEGLLTIDGIVRMNVDLDLGKKNNTVTYTGNGTLFSDGDVRVHSDLLSRSTFPTVDSLGVMTSKIMYLATGGGESQVNMTGAFYAQNKVVSTKQNEIAGSFVAGYFDLGSNVPKIYQVPALSQYLPGGLPKGTTSTTITTLSWRRLGS